MHELLALPTPTKVGDSDSAADAEEYERESETVIFAGVLLALLAMLVWLLMVKV